MSWLSILFSFDGRINRRTYWLHALFPLIILDFIITLLIASVEIFLFSTPGKPYIAISPFLTTPVLFYSLLAIIAKRLHDLDDSGWWSLLVFIPIVGWFFIVGVGIFKGFECDHGFGKTHCHE